MPKFDLSTLGEGQIRLTCYSGENLVNAHHLRMSAACSEANVAAVLAQLGRNTTWASVMPAGDLTKRCLGEYRAAGVDLSQIVLKNSGRNALYFMEPGEFPMPARVTYDREFTPFRQIELSDLDWESLLDTRLAFVTGITAALSEATARAVTHFIDLAYERGIDIALDVNYRGKLWQPDQARDVLSPIAAKSTLLFCSLTDAATVFGISDAGPQTPARLRELLGAQTVISTDGVRAVHLASEQMQHSFAVQKVKVIDRPGAGDAFVGGTIHGYLGGDLLAGVSWGQAAATYALTHHGDVTQISAAELDIPTSTDILR